MTVRKILAKQTVRSAAQSGKALILRLARFVMELAILQLVCAALIMLTGISALRIAFVLFVAFIFLREVLQRSSWRSYALEEDALNVERYAGGKTLKNVRIPLQAIISIRTTRRCERLKTSYRDVIYAGSNLKPSLRMRAAFVCAIVSARLARRVAGSKQDEAAGKLVVYTEGRRLQALLFDPDPVFLEALRAKLPERCEWDDRLARPVLTGLWARALQRAFPEVYPHVHPLMDEESLRWEQERRAKRRKSAPKPKQADAEQQEKG